MDPGQNWIDAELEEAKTRASEKEEHFEKIAEKHTPTHGMDKLTDRAVLQKAVKETAARWEKEGRPITVFRLSDSIRAPDLAAVSAILTVDGYKRTDEEDKNGFEIWKKAAPDGTGA